MFVAAADHSMLPVPRYLPDVSAADQPIVEDRTQHHPLSAIFNNPMVCGARGRYR